MSAKDGEEGEAEKEDTTVAPSPSMSMRFVIHTLKRKWPHVKNISTSTLQTWIDNQGADPETQGVVALSTSNLATCSELVLLDCRPPEEFNVSHMPGSVRVHPDAEDVTSTTSMLQDKPGSLSVVCYCSVGYRSCTYAEALEKLLKKDGYQELKSRIQIFNLEGSLFKWANEKRSMMDLKDNPTPYAHPFNFVFGKLLHKDLRRNHPEK